MDRSGVPLSSILEFFHLVGKLKHLKRTGWVIRKIPDCESISGHMYRMGIMACLIDEDITGDINKARCIKMALIHDIAECIVGDLTPYCGVDKEEKHRREMEAMHLLCSLVGEKIGKEILNLFTEYEEQTTVEAKAVKDLDKLDMLLQAYQYEMEATNSLDLQEFFDNTTGFQNETVLNWFQELQLLRNKNPDRSHVVCEESQSSMFKFFLLIGKLKHLKRTCWILRKIPECETVAGHMYRMSIMAFLLDDDTSPGLNRDKCIKMALLHDVGESIFNDCTICDISKEEKLKRAVELMQRICSPLGERVSKEFLDLYKEYQAQQTIEAKTVKDLDKFDFLFQAYEYERVANSALNLQSTFDETKGFQNSEVLKWAEAMQLHRSKNPPVPCIKNPDDSIMPISIS